MGGEGRPGLWARRTVPGDGTLQGYRNGYEPRKVHTAEGRSIERQVPHVRDTLESFESAWLAAIGRRSSRLVERKPLLYGKGMSQRGIEEARVEALGGEATGRCVIHEVCRSLRSDFEGWQNRDLSVFQVLYLFLDGIYPTLRPEDKRKVAVLCAYGMLWNGRNVLRHRAVGDKERTACWEASLEDMKRRGLNVPLLTVIAGNAGVRKAVEKKLSGSLIQRCQVHKMRNLINTLPPMARPTLRKLLQAAFTARTYQEGLAPARTIIAAYRETFPEAMTCLERDLEECLTALKFPFLHRRQIRAANLLERLFGEGKRRTKIIPRFSSEVSGLSLIFAVLVEASEGWRGVRMKPYIEERRKHMAVDPDSAGEDPDLVKLTA